MLGVDDIQSSQGWESEKEKESSTLEKAGLKGSKEYIALEKQKVQISVKGSGGYVVGASAMFKEGAGSGA